MSSIEKEMRSQAPNFGALESIISLDVGITASLAYPPKLLAANIAELRQKLPESIRLWAGGAGVVRLPRLPEGVIQITNMFDLRANWESLPDLPHPERALL